jgi:sarcosine oxidase delta subunit
MYKTGRYAGKEWTARDGGSLKRSIRVTQKKDKWGKLLWQRRNVRVYAGNYWSYYANIVEFYTPFLRTALTNSLSAVKSIIGAK